MPVTTNPSRDWVRAVSESSDRAARAVAALGDAIHAAHASASPSLARSVQAEQNLYDAIDAEFGLLTSAQASDRMGSRASARRNAATAARRSGRLVALQRGGYQIFPGFQFDDQGIRPIIAELAEIAREHDWGERSLIEWLCSPTTYLDGARPVDVLDDRDAVIDVAERAMEVQW